jgi:hypothetical protein
MKIFRTRCVLLSAALFLLCANILYAQAPLEPSQLPANTSFYFIWRGQPSAELRKTNSIAALWDDPGFAPVRSSITDTLLNNSSTKSADKTAEKTTKPQLTRQQLEQYASLLENPFVLGYISNPQKKGFVVSAVPSAPKPTSWNGIFFIYNRSGKEDILSKAVLAMRAGEKEIPQISQITVADVPTLKVERKTGVTYWVETGKYAVSANETVVLEEILNRLNGKSPAGSLADSPAYKEAQSTLGAGQVEFFLRVPELKTLASDTSAGGFSMRPLLEAIKLDSIHSLSGRVLFEGAKTRVQAVALGDPAPGTLFDIWDQGAAAPPALSLVPAGAYSYTDTEINLSGLYALIERMAASVLPPGREGSGDMLEMMAQAKLGQSLDSALSLFTGEFASLQTSPSLDNNKQVYLVGIRDQPGALKLLRTLFSDHITSERAEGETTFMKISTSGGKTTTPAGKTATSAAPGDFYHVAATADYLVIAPRVEPVRELLAARTHNATAGLATAPGFQSARTQFPATINGIGYFDFRKLDWPALKARLIAQAKTTPPAKRSSAAGVSPMPAWLLNLDPQVFARHLHIASSASWKDAQGLHFDEWIE